jgi:hypothetical protein
MSSRRRLSRRLRRVSPREQVCRLPQRLIGDCIGELDQECLFWNDEQTDAVYMTLFYFLYGRGSGLIVSGFFNFG